MTALSAITIKGFRSIGSAEDLAIRPINVLIGANGSGKSNFLGVFKLLQAIRAGGLQNYVARAGGADRILHFGAKVTENLTIRVAFEDGSVWYEITMVATEGDRMHVIPNEFIHLRDDEEHRQSLVQLHAGMLSSEIKSGNLDSIYVAYPALMGIEAGIGSPDLRKLDVPVSVAVADIQDHLERWRVYHFLDTGSTSPIKKHNDLHDNRFLRPDGANLAAFLYLLREKYASEYDSDPPHRPARCTLLRGLQPGAAGAEPGQDSPGMAAQAIRRLFRSDLALRRHAAVHGPGNLAAAAGFVAPLGHSSLMSRS